MKINLNLKSSFVNIVGRSCSIVKSFSKQRSLSFVSDSSEQDKRLDDIFIGSIGICSAAKRTIVSIFYLIQFSKIS